MRKLISARGAALSAGSLRAGSRGRASARKVPCSCSLRHVYGRQCHVTASAARMLVRGSSFVGTQLPRHLSSGPSLRAGKSRRSGLVVQASFLGVGAPEAILVVIVALVVFGPKGLAQAAKSVGATLKAIQPTIREITEVSTDLKDTLEREIGLDEIRADMRGAVTPTPKPRPAEAAPPPPITPPPPNPSPDSADASSQAAPAAPAPSPKAVTPEMAQALDPDIEAKRAESLRAAWGGNVPVPPTPGGSSAAAPGASGTSGTSGSKGSGTSGGSGSSGSGGSGSSSPAAGGAGSSKQVSDMSLSELEAEIARRRADK